MPLADLKPDRVVNARGTSCPGPLVETKKAIATIPIGGVLETLFSLFMEDFYTAPRRKDL